MIKHMSLRLAWHSDGWNGHICKKPCENVYCVGQHSYPRGLIAEKRDLDYESKYAGESCALHPCKVACGLSVNAFGKETIKIQLEPTKWWGIKEPTILTLPPFTSCTWCYEAMYNDNNVNRQEKARKYFAQFEEGKSLIFYYSGYSNPFSEGEVNNHVIVGISRVKKIKDMNF